METDLTTKALQDIATQLRRIADSVGRAKEKPEAFLLPAVLFGYAGLSQPLRAAASHEGPTMIARDRGNNRGNNSISSQTRTATTAIPPSDHRIILRISFAVRGEFVFITASVVT